MSVPEKFKNGLDDLWHHHGGVLKHAVAILAARVALEGPVVLIRLGQRLQSLTEQGIMMFLYIDHLPCFPNYLHADALSARALPRNAAKSLSVVLARGLNDVHELLGHPRVHN